MSLRAGPRPDAGARPAARRPGAPAGGAPSGGAPSAASRVTCCRIWQHHLPAIPPGWRRRPCRWRRWQWRRGKWHAIFRRVATVLSADAIRIRTIDIQRPPWRQTLLRRRLKEGARYLTCCSMLSPMIISLNSCGKFDRCQRHCR